MAKEQKAKEIQELEETFAKCSVGILTDFKGLKGNDMANLRRLLRKSGIQYRVVKNTLARSAALKLGKDKLDEYWKGPVAIAFGYGEVTQPAKAISDYIAASKVNLSIKGGFLGASVLSKAEVIELAHMPSREVLVARVLGGMQSPISGFVNVLAAPIRGLVNVLDARAKQMEAK